MSKNATVNSEWNAGWGFLYPKNSSVLKLDHHKKDKRVDDIDESLICDDYEGDQDM